MIGLAMRTTAGILVMLAGASVGAAQLEVVVSPKAEISRVRVLKRLPNTISKINRRWYEARRVGNAADNGDEARFIVEDLPEGKYDICIETSEHHLEGVDLGVGAEPGEPVFHWWLPEDAVRTENFDPTTGFEDGVVAGEEEKLEAIRKHFRLKELAKAFETITRVRKFENYVRVIFASGTADEVKALLELRRDGGHCAEKGNEVIWRSEIWTFVWAYGSWIAQNRAAKVLERFRLQRAEFEKLDRLYDPALGGISVSEGEKKTVNYTLPAALDNTIGKAREPQQ